MICEQCQRREATVHFTIIDGEDIKKVNLCEPCCEESEPGFLEKARQSTSYPPPRTRGSQGSQTK
jgi:protein-arginine kinase activator protein McsA